MIPKEKKMTEFTWSQLDYIFNQQNGSKSFVVFVGWGYLMAILTLELYHSHGGSGSTC
jgi:hypothetical protein